jgi:hypothetical protein
MHPRAKPSNASRRIRRIVGEDALWIDCIDRLLPCLDRMATPFRVISTLQQIRLYEIAAIQLLHRENRNIAVQPRLRDRSTAMRPVKIPRTAPLITKNNSIYAELVGNIDHGRAAITPTTSIIKPVKV